MTEINQIQNKKSVILTKQIPHTTRLVKNLDYNAKVSEIESKIPSITGFATSAALTSVENKIPDINHLIKKKTNYAAKTSELEKKVTDHYHGKYITTSEFNNLTAKNFAARLLQTKADFDTKPISLNKKNSIKAKLCYLKMN